MLLQVPGGTPKGGAVSLCLSCRNATVVSGQRSNLISCAELSSNKERELQAIQPVFRCSSYDDKSKPSLSHMKFIAWELKPNKKTGKLGFQQPPDAHSLINPFNGQDTY